MPQYYNINKPQCIYIFPESSLGNKSTVKSRIQVQNMSQACKEYQILMIENINITYRSYKHQLLGWVCDHQIIRTMYSWIPTRGVTSFPNINLYNEKWKDEQNSTQKYICVFKRTCILSEGQYIYRYLSYTNDYMYQEKATYT